MDMESKSTESKVQELEHILKKMGCVLVAFSGGVDSTLLLKVSKDILGDNVLAVTALSETTSRLERDDAVQLADTLGVEHLLVESHELELAEFVANPPDKCYICKKHRFANLISLAQQRGIPHVVDGGNMDDHRDFRPGIRATQQLGIRSPLMDAGLSKEEIRRLSKQLLLPTWNKPSAACLASRIPYHEHITADKLKQVDAGEQFLRDLGLSDQVRLRHHGNIARLEVDVKDIPRLIDENLRHEVTNFLKSIGFTFIALDLEGYSVGSLNRTLADMKGHENEH